MLNTFTINLEIPNLADMKDTAEEKKIQLCHTNIFSEILMQKRRKKKKKESIYMAGTY